MCFVSRLWATTYLIAKAESEIAVAADSKIIYSVQGQPVVKSGCKIRRCSTDSYFVYSGKNFADPNLGVSLVDVAVGACKDFLDPLARANQFIERARPEARRIAQNRGEASIDLVYFGSYRDSRYFYRRGVASDVQGKLPIFPPQDCGASCTNTFIPGGTHTVIDREIKMWSDKPLISRVIKLASNEIVADVKDELGLPVTAIEPYAERT